MSEFLKAVFEGSPVGILGGIIGFVLVASSSTPDNCVYEFWNNIDKYSCTSPGPLTGLPRLVSLPNDVFQGLGVGAFVGTVIGYFTVDPILRSLGIKHPEGT